MTDLTDQSNVISRLESINRRLVKDSKILVNDHDRLVKIVREMKAEKGKGRSQSAPSHHSDIVQKMSIPKQVDIDKFFKKYEEDLE